MKPVQRIERSYTRERKIQILLWLKYYRVLNQASNTAVKMRSPTLDEAACFFQIPKSTLAYWMKPEISERIIQSKLNTRSSIRMFLCMWPEMEGKLFEAFIERRKLGRPVRDSWFRRKGLELWKECYHPQLATTCDLFVFSQGWFRGFLSRHRIVLRFVTNTAQALPTDYKQEILKWLRFNRRNRILAPITACVNSELVSSPYSLHYICNDNEGGIPHHRICNADETPMPWEYLTGRTYHLQGDKTVWSKSADSGSEKRQCTLFLCIFADGVPRIPPIIIFTAATGKTIRAKESHLWDKRVHIEFSPTGWMNEELFLKFIRQFLIPLFGGQRALFVYDRYRAHLTAPVLQLCRNNKITPSLIPAGTTPLTQPLDVAINKPFKGLVKEHNEVIREYMEDENKLEDWTVSHHRIATTRAVGRAWEAWGKSIEKQKIVIQSFRNTGISLPVDGSRDHEIKIKGFRPDELVIGDWARSEQETGYGTSESENTELQDPDSLSTEYRLQDE